MPSYPPVQSVVRAFGILRELNQRHITTVDHLHKATRLPKPTIVRLLETLIGEGFVTTDKRLGGYCVTSSVRTLSAGYHGTCLVLEAGRSHCSDLTHLRKWPVSIAVFENPNLVIRFSTIPDSSISPFHATLNMKLDPLSTGHGRAYLAYCSDKEREAMLRTVSARKGGDARTEDAKRFVDDIVQRVRRQGYGERDPMREPKSSSTVAMPVRYRDQVLGTVGLTYFTSAVQARDVQRLLVAPLRECVDKIQRNASELLRQRESSP